MNFNEPHRPFTAYAVRSLTFLYVIASGLIIGCDQPIYRSIETDKVPTVASDLTATESSDSDRYLWPLSRSVYSIQKPPQMAYISALGERIELEDPLTAPLVPWNDETLDARAAELLHHAYDSFDPNPNPDFSLALDQFAGANAFDISSNGERLVTIDSQGLALYRVSDGKSLGHLALPADVAQARPQINAVRFAGDSSDMLVGSADGIFRISGETGKVIAQHKGCNDSIADWQVAVGSDVMLIRTSAGQLFSGNCDLSDFQRCTTSLTANFDSASISPDGRRIGVVADHSPRVYLLAENQLVDEQNFGSFTLDPQTAIAMGISTDCWADGDGLYYHVIRDGVRTSEAGYHMFWKPHLISATSSDGSNNSLLVAGTRATDQGIENILYDYGPHSRNSSMPIRIQEQPTRMAHSRDASTVALLGKSGLHVYRRTPWRSRGPIFLSTWLYPLIDSNEFGEIENLVTIIQSQKRLGFALTSAQLVDAIVNSLAQRWTYLEANAPDSEVLQYLNDWRKNGSVLSMTTSAVRHYKTAWSARGTGTSSTVTQEGWEIFQAQGKLAVKEAEAAIELENPPLEAFSTLISSKLDQTGELESVDSVCREACRLYPGEPTTHSGVLIKLLPQWYGELGDLISFARSASRIVTQPDSDLLYFALVGKAFYFLHPDANVHWKSYDYKSFNRGIAESQRRGESISERHYLAWCDAIARLHDRQAAQEIARLIITETPSPYYIVTDGSLKGHWTTMQSERNKYFEEAKRKSLKGTE